MYVFVLMLYILGGSPIIASSLEYDDLRHSSDIDDYYHVNVNEWSYKHMGYKGYVIMGTQELGVPIYRHFSYEIYDVTQDKTFTMSGESMILMFHDRDSFENLSLFKVMKPNKEILFCMPEEDRAREIFEQQFLHYNPPEVIQHFLPLLDTRAILMASQEQLSPRSPRATFLKWTQSSPF